MVALWAARVMARSWSVGDGHVRVHVCGGSGGSELRLGGLWETRRISWEHRGGPSRADWARMDVAVQAGVPWQKSSGVDSTSVVSSGSQAVFCEEDASLDASCGGGDGGSVLIDPGSVSEVSFLHRSCVVTCNLPSLLVPFLRDVFCLCF